MTKCNPYETHNIYPNLNEHFRLNKINEVKDYFIAEITKWELISKRLSKFDKSLIVF